MSASIANFGTKISTANQIEHSLDVAIVNISFIFVNLLKKWFFTIQKALENIKMPSRKKKYNARFPAVSLWWKMSPTIVYKNEKKLLQTKQKL